MGTGTVAEMLYLWHTVPVLAVSRVLTGSRIARSDWPFWDTDHHQFSGLLPGAEEDAGHQSTVTLMRNDNEIIVCKFFKTFLFHS